MSLLVIIANTSSAQKIDRKAVVLRHTVVNKSYDSLSSLSVGNGNFAFTVDVTGLQSFPEAYAKGVALGTQSIWGWHSFIDTANYKFEETLKELYKKFLEKHTEIKALKFSLYIPNFNDGAACVLTFSGVEVFLKELDEQYKAEKEKYEKENDDCFDEDEFWNNSDSLGGYLADYSTLIKDLEELDGLLDSAESLLEKGIHPNIISEGN